MLSSLPVKGAQDIQGGVGATVIEQDMVIYQGAGVPNECLNNIRLIEYS